MSKKLCNSKLILIIGGLVTGSFLFSGCGQSKVDYSKKETGSAGSSSTTSSAAPAPTPTPDADGVTAESIVDEANRALTDANVPLDPNAVSAVEGSSSVDKTTGVLGTKNPKDNEKEIDAQESKTTPANESVADIAVPEAISDEAALNEDIPSNYRGVIRGRYQPFLQAMRGVPEWVYWSKPKYMRSFSEAPIQLDRQEKEALGYTIASAAKSKHTVLSRIVLKGQKQQRCVFRNQLLFGKDRKTPVLPSHSIALHNMKSNKPQIIQNVPQPFVDQDLVCVDLEQPFPSELVLSVVDDNGTNKILLEGAHGIKYIPILGGQIEFKITQRLTGRDSPIGWGFDGAMKTAMNDDFDLLHNSFIAYERPASCGLERTLFVRAELNKENRFKKVFALVQTRQADIHAMHDGKGQPVNLSRNGSTYQSVRADTRGMRVCRATHLAWLECLKTEGNAETCDPQKHQNLIMAIQKNFSPLLDARYDGPMSKRVFVLNREEASTLENAVVANSMEQGSRTTPNPLTLENFQEFTDLIEYK